MLEKKTDVINNIEHVENIEYHEIATIDYQQTKTLKTRKINGENLSDHEQASVTKFWFLCTLIENCATQEMCWEYYNKYGFTKFGNIGYEKEVVNGAIRIRDLLESTRTNSQVLLARSLCN